MHGMRFKTALIGIAGIVILSILFCPEIYAARKTSDGKRSSKSPSKTSGKTSSTDEKKVKWVKSPDAIPALIELSKSRKEMVDIYKAETQAYKKVKAAYDDGTFEKGMPREEAARKFGPPVVIDEGDGGVSKWVYKPSSESFFSKEKMYLYFDAEGKLFDWKGPPKDKGKGNS